MSCEKVQCCDLFKHALLETVPREVKSIGVIFFMSRENLTQNPSKLLIEKCSIMKLSHAVYVLNLCVKIFSVEKCSIEKLSHAVYILKACV